jgi:hypothetical protein
LLGWKCSFGGGTEFPWGQSQIFGNQTLQLAGLSRCVAKPELRELLHKLPREELLRGLRRELRNELRY